MKPFWRRIRGVLPSNWVLLALFVALPGLRLAAQDKGADWPQFRGAGGQGVSATRDLPLTWSPTENVAWKSELPGAGTSSPIVVGSRVFVTCYSGYSVPGQPRGDLAQLKLHVVCLNRADGKLLWNKEVAPKLPEQEGIREGHGYASGTPVADGERVYVFLGRTGVIAFDHQGRQLWQTEVGSQVSGWGSAASPILFGDLLIVNASVESESLVALDKKTGTEKWRASGIREAWNTPLMVPVGGGKTELVIASYMKLLAFDPATGKPLWSCATDINWYMVPSLVAHQGIVYCIGGRSGGSLAVRAGGQGDVTGTHRLWTGRKGSNVSSPLIHEGHLYWMNDNNESAYCAEAQTGNLVYEQQIGRAGQVYASPVLAGGKIYYVTRNGRTFVVAAKPAYELLANNETADRGTDGSTFNASPAIAGSQLFLRSDRFLYCLGRK